MSSVIAKVLLHYRASILYHPVYEAPGRHGGQTCLTIYDSDVSVDYQNSCIGTEASEAAHATAQWRAKATMRNFSAGS